MAGAAALATSLPTVAQTAARVHAATDSATEPIASADAQPQLDHARRVFAALARLGESVGAADVSGIQQLADEGRLADAATAAVRLLQARVLVTVVVTPEARVSVQRTQTRAKLVQGGWRLALVRVHNPAGVPGRLQVSSPNAVPVHGVAPGGGINSGPAVPTTRGDMAQRWLDVGVHDEAPLDATLEPVPADFKILRLYARDAGRRSATLKFDIGPGTGGAVRRWTCVGSRKCGASARPSAAKKPLCTTAVGASTSACWPRPRRESLGLGGRAGHTGHYCGASPGTFASTARPGAEAHRQPARRGPSL